MTELEPNHKTQNLKKTPCSSEETQVLKEIIKILNVIMKIIFKVGCYIKVDHFQYIHPF